MTAAHRRVLSLFHLDVKGAAAVVITQRHFSCSCTFPQSRQRYGLALAMWVTHVGTYRTNMLIVLGPVTQTEPQAGPRLISGIHEPNQSVINLLYGTNLDDKMSGNIQG